MNEEKETASNLIAEISWLSKCAKEQADMLGHTGYQKEYHIRKTIAEALARIGYRKVGEVHEPKIETEEWIAPHGWQAKAYCPNCGTELSRSFEFSSNENIAIDKALSYAPNYCPNCGARLKEVDE